MVSLSTAMWFGFALTHIVYIWITLRLFHGFKNAQVTASTRTNTFSAVASSSPSSSPVGCTTGIPCDRYDDIVDYRIIVITYSRTKSLTRLLATLDDLVLDDHKAALEIWIDVDKNGNTNSDTLAAARSFKWKKGVSRVHIQSRNAGIMGQWIDTWRPRPDSHEIGLILEDDLIVSPMTLRWLKHVHREMETRDRTDYAGATLQGEKDFLSPNNGGPLVGPVTDTIVMYKGFGTWGFSPNPVHWRRFQDWFHLHEPSVLPNFHPYVNVPECLPNQWYIKFEGEGTAQNMWEMWFMYYMHVEQLFGVYSNLDAFTSRNDTCLAINMKEPGLHFSGPAPPSRCTLLKNWNEKFVQFPEIIARLHWDGKSLDGRGYF